MDAWRICRTLTPLAVVALLATACASEESASGAPAAGPRGILLVTVDGLVADVLSVTGGPIPTPGLERLADGGTLWRDAWTTCPMTRPAVATYLTGLAPDRHGVIDDVSVPLPQNIPTLATLLAERGFRTAAFPDSSFLGFSSGLLRGFELVDEPPPANFSVLRNVPRLDPTAEPAENFATWLAGLGPEERWFAWIHSTAPLQHQLVIDPTRAPPVIEEFDGAIVRILDAIESRPGAEQVAIVVAGTSADLTGGEDGLAGLGLSLDERAIRVPVIARLPADAPAPRSAASAVWAPDVPLTLAALAGTGLPGSEGLELWREPPADRVRLAWTAGTRDQLGWRAQRAARQGALKRIEGIEERTFSLDGAGGTADPAVTERLRQALQGRDLPTAARVPLDRTRGILEARGLTLSPVPDTGRDFGPAPARLEAARAIWKSRVFLSKWMPHRTTKALETLAEHDPDSQAALLDLGQLLVGNDPARAQKLLARAVELYPERPEVIHWYVHANWDCVQSGCESLLQAALEALPGDPDLLYDLACVRSMEGDLDGSMVRLRESIEAGYRRWEHMEVDPDLRNLRESGRFAELMREYRQ